MAQDWEIRLILALAIFGAVALWEALAPRRRLNFGRLARWPSNLALVALDAAIVREKATVRRLITACHEIAATGLNATARDLARLALLILDESPAVPADARQRIFAGGDRTLFASSRHGARAGGSYRSQWWISHNAQRAISALGVYGQRVHIEPEAEMALIRFGSHPLASNLHTDGLHQAAIGALRQHLSA